MSTQSFLPAFSVPPKEYSPAPIWWWSGERLDAQRLRWQLERFAEGGVYNLIVLNLAPTSPLYGSDADDPPLFSEEWWEIFLGVCGDARELGVRIWFYDQIGFSGANFQGEVVRENGVFAGEWLESVIYEGSEPAELICPTEGIPLSAAATPLDPTGEPSGPPVAMAVNGRSVSAAGGQFQRVRLVYAVRRGFDYFSPDACGQLFDRVHGEFERRAIDYFGDVIVGSFQDELPSLATWGAGFAAAFQARMGYDIVPRLPDLWDGRGDAADRLRSDYHHVRAELAEAAFFKPLFDWHERYGLLCGFDQQGPARAGHPVTSVHFYADYLRTHRWFTVPGSDHHGEAKIHSSLAHLYDRPRVWIESFHSSGWGGTLEETYDWLLPWLRAGATLYDPHAVYYSTRGGWWEWAPPSTCWRQPYWRHYPHFARTVSRLCYALSQGHHVCDIGVLFPSATVQAGLAPDGQPLLAAQAAHMAYEQLVGSMFWQDMRPGILDKDRRDYDVIDDASLQRARVEDGALIIGAECYRALVLPECRTLEAASVDVLLRFVDGGGLLIAIGALPALSVVSDSDALGELRQRFADGRARQIDDAESLPLALAPMQRVIDAPVPTLHRRIDGRDVLFVPAAAPYATRQERNRSWLDVAYSFDPGDYQRNMCVTVRGVRGVPELWDPYTGTTRPLPATAVENGVTVEIPFESGPAALLVWPAADVDAVAPTDSGRTSRLETIHELESAWTVTVEPTLENRYGDLARPASPGAPPVQTWRFQHHTEAPGEDGLAAGWQTGSFLSSPRETVIATFGPQGWYVGPKAPAELPDSLAEIDQGGDMRTAGWQPAIYSLSRGVRRDPIHLASLGPNGHVPEEFLLFGRTEAGQGVQFRTAVWMDEATEITMAIGAPAAKRLWVNGQEMGSASAGYLWMVPVPMQAGMNTLELRLIAEQTLNMRCSWSLVRDTNRYARPEWMTTPDAPVRHSSVSFVYDLELPFQPKAATIQVGADAPCRVLVNGREAGRQGGFDPYYSTARVQPYPLGNLREGHNHIELQMQDLGRRAAIVVDGIATGPSGEQITWMSGPQWQVRRDDGAAAPVRLRRRQWVDMQYDFVESALLDMDPSYSNLWRRPHPLPEATWLEDEPADDSVLAVAPDPFAGKTRVEWLTWTIPPGAMGMNIPVAGDARLWIDGQEEMMSHDGHVSITGSLLPRTAVMRVEPARGCSGGRLLQGPVAYTLGAGRMTLGLWGDRGLESYSGGVRYRQTVDFHADAAGRFWLDLGRVRGTAEVWVNGRPAGVRVFSPYRFDVSGLLRSGANEIEVLVLNTLAPYLDAQSPTFYIFPGQCDSGMLGPVRLLADSA